MDFGNETHTVVFANSQTQSDVELQAIGEGLTAFLEHFGEAALIGQDFQAIIGEGSGETRLRRLLEATNYAADPPGFIRELLDRLAAANNRDDGPIRVGGVALPHLLLVHVLEKILPGDDTYSVEDVPRLERLTNTSIPASEHEDLQKVIETYPVRLSMHTLRQIRVSNNVAYQYLPFVEELDPSGHTNTWIGQFHQGLLEQMYQNRVIFLLNMSCPVYCRFCFRKHKETRKQANPSTDDVRRAIEHVRNSPTIKEIVITGGDPFLNRANMECAVDGLLEVPHVQTLRLATRSIAYHPHFFFANNAAWLNYLKRKNLEAQQKGKRIEVATHFIHPEEISPDCLEIITTLVKNGIAVYVQTPFLNDCNDKGPELVRLFSLLRGAGAELHYIYIPCSPIHGNRVYWTPIAKGLAAANHLRAYLSDRVIPRICTATPIGKMDWHSSGWAVEPVENEEHFFWIRTPYTPGYFKAFAPIANELDIVRVNAEGTIDIKYMAQIGDEALFCGSRPPREDAPRPTDPEARRQLQAEALEDQRLRQSIVATGSQTLSRQHLTRVEIDTAATPADLDSIREDTRITDVVIAGRQDAVEALHAVEALVRRLQEVPHVNAVRLRSLAFNYAPHRYDRGALDRLGSLNRLTIANPTRLEIETHFLHADEIRPEHARLAEALRNRGITVYSNTPLLGGVNDNADDIHTLAYRLRELGVEFHHLYVAGLPIQRARNAAQPIGLDDVIDIATKVRREGSGREIPRYIVRTPLGEVDFGLTSTLQEQDGRVALKLLCFDLAYFKAIDPAFEWPGDVTVADDGKPIVSVPGISKKTGFALT